MLDTQITPFSEAIRSLQFSANTLISYSLPWNNFSPLQFLANAHHQPHFYWAQADLSVAGVGEVTSLTASGENRFTEIESQALALFADHIYVTPATPYWAAPRLFGGFSFRTDDNQDPFWVDFPEAVFILPEVQLTQKEHHTWLTLNYIVNSDDDLNQIESWFQQKLDWLENLPNLQIRGSQYPISSQPLLDQSAWNKMISEAVIAIKNGDMDKVVLARPVQVTADDAINIPAALAALDERYPDTYRFLFEPQPGKAFLGATPELLVSVDQGLFSADALAGSIARGQTDTEDQALGQELLNSEKDCREHDFVVQALKRRLTPLTSKLTIESEPHLRVLKNIQHLETNIEGQLNQDTTALSLLAILHPTPALGGAPRRIALPYIQQAESFSRGWYAAPIGWFAPNGDGTFAVGIRSAVIDNDKALLYAGCGIVAESDPEKEWQETELKLQPLLHALGGEGG